jgi:murein DD-endopeptidase MepM/ murein hydrolase activator NlpD
MNDTVAATLRLRVPCSRALLALLLLMACAVVNAEGFDRRYKLYSGDINSDGSTDIYVRWRPEIILIPYDDLSIPIPRGPRGATDFILQQGSQGSFTILSNLSPAQATTVRSWPELAATVVRVIEDYNADGFMDLALRNLDSVITGIPDQIVYAATARNAAPVQARRIDAALLKFAKELYGWVADADYFRDHARRVTVPSGRYETYLGYILEPYPPYSVASCLFYDTCEFAYGNVDAPFVDPNNTDSTLNVWHWWGIQNVTGNTWLDYSVFDSRALQLAGVLAPVIAGQVDIVAGGNIEQGIKSTLLSVLGTAVYGGVFALQQNVYIDEEEIQTDRLRALLQLLATLPEPNPIIHVFTNPLPGAWINKRNTTTPPYNCTADGRFGNFRPRGHGGVDLGSSSTVAVNIGTDVYAAADGSVLPIPNTPGHGLMVELYYADYIFRYGHLSGAASRGRVAGGAVVGQVGKSGNASPACIKTHLHFEIGDNALGTVVDPASVSSEFTWFLEP